MPLCSLTTFPVSLILELALHPCQEVYLLLPIQEERLLLRVRDSPVLQGLALHFKFHCFLCPGFLHLVVALGTGKQFAEPRQLLGLIEDGCLLFLRTCLRKPAPFGSWLRCWLGGGRFRPLPFDLLQRLRVGLGKFRLVESILSVYQLAGLIKPVG